MNTFFTSVKASRASGPARAQARALEAAEGRPVADRRVRVDRQVAGLDGPGHPQRAADVLGPDRARQPVGRVVGQARWRRPRPRTAPPPPPGRTPPRCRPGRSVATGASTVGGNQKPGPSGAWPRKATGASSGTNDATRLAVAGRDQRAHVGVGLGRVADPHAADRRLQQLHEPVVGRALDEDARPGAAVLPGVVEHGRRRRGRGPLQVGVGEDDVGALAAQLEGEPLHVRGAAGHDPLAHLGGAGEDDLAHVGVVDQALADHRARRRPRPGTRPPAARRRGPARRGAARSAA